MMKIKNQMRKYKQRGVTLVELMISLTLGIIVLGGGIQIFISGQQAYNEAQRFNKLQSDLSLIVDLIAFDLRGATSFSIDGIDGSTLNIGSISYTKKGNVITRKDALAAEPVPVVENVSVMSFECIPVVDPVDCTTALGVATTIQLEGAQAMTFQVGLRNRILAKKFGS